MEQEQSAGSHLKKWRIRRRLSQLQLALGAEISQRHLSFVESGRSHPSRDMIMHLAHHLGVPLREQNLILNAAGYAPQFPHRPFESPELSVARVAIDQILRAHLPHPALAVDRYWTLLSANAAVEYLLADVAPHLLEGDVNVLRLSLHPEGLAPRILNLGEWRGHLLSRLGHEIEVTADARLAALAAELAAMPCPAPETQMRAMARTQSIAVPLRLKSPDGPLSFISTSTIFGTAVDVTLSEVTIEAFYPADDETVGVMAALGHA